MEPITGNILQPFEQQPLLTKQRNPLGSDMSYKFYRLVAFALIGDPQLHNYPLVFDCSPALLRKGFHACHVFVYTKLRRHWFLC